MNKTAITIVLACLPIQALSADANPLAGRWTGEVHIPGRDLNVIVDLAQNAAGSWQGSIIIPGLDLKGAPLANLVVTGDNVTFDTGSALEVKPYGGAKLAWKLAGKDAASGEFRLGGNTAPMKLKKTGTAQVELTPQNTPVSPGLEGMWTGGYEMGGYPRKVSLKLENHAGAPATAELVIVGKVTTKVPVDVLIEEEGMLRIESHAYRIIYEGRTGGNTEINGTFSLGPFELPLVLRPAVGSKS